MEVLQAIYTRKSTRGFKPDPVAEEIVDEVLKAGAAAPVGMGAFNSLHLTVVTDPVYLDKINKAASKNFPNGGGAGSLIYNAPVLILVASQPGRIPGIDYANAGCVVENILLAATSYNLGSVYLFMPSMAFQNEPELYKELDIPEGFTVISSAVIGYVEEELTSRDVGQRIEVNKK